MNITATTALFLAKPIITRVSSEMFASVITDENLAKAKQGLIESVQSITGKTSFVWDDKLANMIIEKMSDPDFYQKWGDKILDPLENWVEATETQWDDLLIMPVFTMVRTVCDIPDND